MLQDVHKFYNVFFLSIIIFIIILFGMSPYSLAQTPGRLVNFQGKLTDQQGQSLDGAYTVIFSLYSTATGGTALWSERHENLSITNGLVNALLGSIQSLDEPQRIKFDGPRYLGITIDVDNNENSPDPEMLPRQRIIPAIYAYNASNADTLDGRESDFFTNTETDAGRSGVVEDLYEGDTRLSDKYIAKDTTEMNADTVDGYHAGVSGAEGTIPVIDSSVTYSSLKVGYATSANNASSAGSCNSCSSASSCSSCSNASNCSNCSNASKVNGLQFSPYRICIANNADRITNRIISTTWPSNWSSDSCRNWACGSCNSGSWFLNNISSNGSASVIASGGC